MFIEHIAFDVPEPAAAAAWYCMHLGMMIARKVEGPAQAHFLADAAGRVVIEIYNNPKVTPPDYRRMDPLILHVAFAAGDVDGARKRLLAAGATPEGETTIAPNGDVLAMVRDPWGFPVQIVKRATPLLSPSPSVIPAPAALER
jgi:catechol 2,3-dioxygenase-like lactoylglutathione lyase family enzyme